MTGRELSEQNIEGKIERKLATMPGYAAEWNTEMQISGQAASTRLDYMRKLDHFLKFINNGNDNVKASEITRDKVVEYCGSLLKKDSGADTSDSYKQTTWFFLNKFFKFMQSAGYMETNYMDGIARQRKNLDLDRINQHRVKLTKEDFNKIKQAAACEPDEFLRVRNQAILAVMMTTGIRETACLSILVSDADLEKNILTVVDKNKKTFQFSIIESTKEAIIAWLSIRPKVNGRNDPHLFLTKEGNPMSRNSLVNLIKKYTKEALGKALSPHKIRAGVCTILFDETGSVEMVRRFVGHSSIRTTERYIVTSMEERKQCAEMLA